MSKISTLDIQFFNINNSTKLHCIIKSPEIDFWSGTVAVQEHCCIFVAK